MFTYYELLEYKEKYKGYKLLYLYFERHEFIFRSLTRKEYKNIMSISSNDMELEDLILTVSCIYPEDYNFAFSTLAGIPSRLSKRILDMSGFLSLDTVMQYFDESKHNVRIYDTQLMLLVKAAFPEYPMDEIEEWTFERLIDMATKAEYIMNLKGHNIELTEYRKKFEESIETEANRNKYEFAEELRLNGIDPMIFNKAMFTEEKEFVEMPVIMGINWNNEGVLNAVREQMEKRKNRKLQNISGAL